MVDLLFKYGTLEIERKNRKKNEKERKKWNTSVVFIFHIQLSVLDQVRYGLQCIDIKI